MGLSLRYKRIEPSLQLIPKKDAWRTDRVARSSMPSPTVQYTVVQNSSEGLCVVD